MEEYFDSLFSDWNCIQSRFALPQNTLFIQTQCKHVTSQRLNSFIFHDAYLWSNSMTFEMGHSCCAGPCRVKSRALNQIRPPIQLGTPNIYHANCPKDTRSWTGGKNWDKQLTLTGGTLWRGRHYHALGEQTAKRRNAAHITGFIGPEEIYIGDHPPLTRQSMQNITTSRNCNQ